jgi:hypothetical protein
MWSAELSGLAVMLFARFGAAELSFEAYVEIDFVNGKSAHGGQSIWDRPAIRLVATHPD